MKLIKLESGKSLNIDYIESLEHSISLGEDVYKCTTILGITYILSEKEYNRIHKCSRIIKIK